MMALRPDAVARDSTPSAQDLARAKHQRVGLFLLCGLLVVAYNPWFNHANLFLREWSGASYRATTVTYAWIGAMVILAVSARMQAAMRSIAVALPTMLVILAVVCLSLLVGHDEKMVISDVFPFAEAAMFGSLASVVIGRTSEAVRWRWLEYTFWWVGITAVYELWLYRSSSGHFESRFLNADGLILARLDDFVPALLLPVAVLCALAADSRRLRAAAVLCAASGAGVLLVGFFRSIWLATLCGLGVAIVLWLRLHRPRGWGLRVLVGGVGAVLVLNFSPGMLHLPGNVPSLAQDRILGPQLAQERSLSGRIEANRDLVAEIKRHPLGVGFGTTYYNESRVQRLPISSVPNYPLGFTLQVGIIPMCILVALGLREVRRRARVAGLTKDDSLWFGCMMTYGVTLLVSLLLFPSILHFPLFALFAMFYAGTARPAVPA